MLTALREWRFCRVTVRISLSFYFIFLFQFLQIVSSRLIYYFYQGIFFHSQLQNWMKPITKMIDWFSLPVEVESLQYFNWFLCRCRNSFPIYVLTSSYTVLSTVGSVFQYYPLEEVLAAEYLLEDFRPDLIQMVLDKLRPEHVRSVWEHQSLVIGWVYCWDLSSAAQLPDHYCADSSSQWCLQHKMAAPVLDIFWLNFL